MKPNQWKEISFNDIVQEAWRRMPVEIESLLGEDWLWNEICQL